MIGWAIPAVRRIGGSYTVRNYARGIDMSITTAASIAAIKGAIGALSGIQSAAVLRERIALIQDQVALLEKAAAEAEAKIASQAKQIEELNRELLQHRRGEQETEYRGALFKRNPGGRDGYQPVAFCPTCKTSTGSTSSGRMPLLCGKCGWVSAFRANELPAIIREINGL